MSAYGEIPADVREALTLRSRGRCEASLRGCYGVAVHAHHKKYKSRNGTNALVNLAHVCVFCHHAIHGHKDGTAKFRTHTWQDEGKSELDAKGEA